MDNSMTGQHDLLAHVEDDLRTGAFTMTNLLTLLAYGTETGECAWCGAHVGLEQLTPVYGEADPETGMAEVEAHVCDACMGPIRQEHARMEMAEEDEPVNPLDEGFHGSSIGGATMAPPIDEQVVARQAWAPEGRPVRTRRQEKEQFLVQHPAFCFPADTHVGPILACNIPLQEVVRQVRSALACVTEPGSERHSANAVAEKSYRAFLLTVGE